jgi:tetratricopeptide (TPR) repeat protein
MPRSNVCLFTLSLALMTVSGYGQQAPARKPPTIIRDTGVAEGKTDAEVAVKKEYNPALAAADLERGKFYFKNGNYDAAISRFQEALEYHPKLVDAYDALGRAYEKKGDLEKAMNVYKDFVKKNPDAPKVADFKSRSDRLEKELGKKK